MQFNIYSTKWNIRDFSVQLFYFSPKFAPYWLSNPDQSILKKFRCIAQNLIELLDFSWQLFPKFLPTFFGEFPYDVIMNFQLFLHFWVELILLIPLIYGSSISIKKWLRSAQYSTIKIWLVPPLLRRRQWASLFLIYSLSTLIFLKFKTNNFLHFYLLLLTCCADVELDFARLLASCSTDLQ